MSPHSSRLATCLTRFRIPSVTAQHSVGKSAFRKPRHPDVDLPSNNSFQPAAFSLAESTFWTTSFPLPADPKERDTIRQTIARLASHSIQTRKLQQPGDGKNRRRFVSFMFHSMTATRIEA